MEVESNELYGVTKQNTEKENDVENSVKEKPTLNDIRKKNGLGPIPDGDVILTKV